MPIAAGFHFLNSDGGSLLKPPVILIHGAGWDHLFWPPEIRRMPGYRIYSLDLPGHGKTRGPGRQFIEKYSADVTAFMDALGVSRAVIAGHGMGGAISLSLACNNPDRIAGAVMISSGPYLPIPATILEDAANISTFPQAVKKLGNISIGSQTTAALRESIFRRLGEARQSLLLNDLVASQHFNMLDSLGSVDCPVLVVCGTEDKFTPIHLSEALSGKIRGAALQTMDGASHMVPLEQPRRLARILQVFLSTIRYSPGT